MKVACIIPSRYGSTRLPGKPLRLIGGEPLIRRVYERVILAKTPDLVMVATDDERILKEVQNFGGRAIITAKTHRTGTDRLAEAAENLIDYDIIINVQGDEPFISPAIIDQLVNVLKNSRDLSMATVATPMKEKEYNDSSAVKVVMNQKQEALYFSRSLIPFPREIKQFPVWKHVGIYAYRRDFLLHYAKMEQTPLEKVESLEQLRALENGYKIGVIITQTESIGIDTEEDLIRANEYWGRSKQ